MSNIHSMTAARFSRRRALRYAGVGGLGVLGAALIGCGDDDDDDDAAASGATTTAGTTVASADAPKDGGIYKTFIGTEPTNLDNTLDTSVVVSANTAAPIYSKLLRWRTGPGVTPGSILDGDAAGSWESSDGQTWTFKLRDNLKFHPRPPVNGRAADSEDVKSSLERYLDVSPAKGTLEGLIDSFETPDASTFTVRLKESYPPFSEVLTGLLSLWIHPKESNSGQIDPQSVEGAIGTGPWMWKEIKSSVSRELERHPEWHIKDEAGRQVPHAAGWTQVIIPEYAQAIAQFAAGELSEFPPTTEDAKGLLERVPDAQINPVRPSPNFNMFGFHMSTPASPMLDTRLRRAWSMAFNRAELFEAFGQFEKGRELGFDLVAAMGNPPVPDAPGFEFWLLDPFGPDMGPAGRWFQHDPAEAKRLIEAAGYDGEEVVIHVPSPRFVTVLEAHVAPIADVGFNPVIDIMEFSQYVSGPYSGNGPFTVAFGNYTPFPTVDEFCFNYMMEGGIRNMPGLTDSVEGATEVFDLVRAQRREADRDARREIIHDIQRKTADQMWWVPSINFRWGTLSFGQANVRGFGEYDGVLQAPAEQTWPFYWLDV